MSFNSEQRNNNNFLQPVSFVGAILLPLALLFMLWAIQRGLNITDESMYLVSSQFPTDVKFGLTSYHLYTSLLFRGVGQNIIALRFVQLVMTISGGVVFYVGLNRFISRYKVTSDNDLFANASAFSFCCLGSMLAYFWFLPTPSYNSLNSFALTASSGLLMSLSRDSGEIPGDWSLKSRIIFFLIGLCIGLAFFAKFTAAILLFLLYIAIICVSAGQRIKDKVNCILIISLGIASWVLLHFTSIQSPVVWWRYFANGLQLAAAMSAGYDGSSLTRYFYEVAGLGKRALFDFWALHLIILLGLGNIYYFRKSLKNAVELISALFGLVFAIGVALSIYRHLYVGGQSQCFNMSRFYLSWLFLLTTAAVASFAFNYVHDRKMPRQALPGLLSVAILLFCLPIAGAIGTGSPLYINLLLNMAPWFGLLFLQVALLSWLHRIQWIAPVMCVMFSLFAFAQIITGSLYYPYQLLTGLLGQTQATEIGYPSTVLKLDPITSEYFTQIKALAQKHGFKPGDDVVALYDLPGVVFALGGRSPALPWHIGNPRKSPVATAEKALSFADQERLKHAFILLSSKSDRFMPELRKFGLSFPSGYLLCGEVNNPYDPSKGTVRLWKPF